MKLPIVPIVVAATVLLAAVFALRSIGPTKHVLGIPKLTKLIDIEGTETEAEISPDGVRCAVIASGDLWLWNLQDGTTQRVTSTPEEESDAAWTADGRKVSFSKGPDTFVTSVDDPHALSIFKPNGTGLNWSAGGKIAFVRDRGLWVSDGDGSHEQQLVAPDPNKDMVIRSPRFSPDSTQIVFIKSLLNLRGEVWLVTVGDGKSQPLAGRPAENPLDADWIMNGNELVYLTNRSGAYALWRINVADTTVEPLTVTLDAAPLARLRISAWKDRIFVPRHFLDSDIILSDGATVAHSGDIEFDPAGSPDGKMVAYTVQKDTRFEIWTAGVHGENPIFRALGQEPRFSPSGFEIVYTNTDPAGNQDVWKLDLRNSASESLTDDPGIDLQPDWSADGRTIAFTSARGGPLSIWTVPADGGKRLRLNDGLYPKFFDSGRSLLFWDQNAFWSIDTSGGNRRRIRDNIGAPAPAVWTAGGPKYYADADINGGRTIWPVFDVLPDGRKIISPIHIQETSLWAVDLTYTSK